MHIFSILTAAIAGILIGQTWSVPVIVHPGGVNDLVITSQNTLNETIHAPNSMGTSPLPAVKSEQLSISVFNNFNSGNVNVYVTGLNSSGNIVLLTPRGTWYTPPTNNGSSTPQQITEEIANPIGAYGTTTSITLPTYVSSGRVWVADGDLKFFTVIAATGILSLVEPSAANPHDPSADINWGFIELTTNSDGITVNLSYVDFIGLPLGIEVQGTAGIQTALGVTKNASSSICDAFTSQSSSDGQAWNKLCVIGSSGNVLRVISPCDYISLHPTAFSSYWTNYVSQVWSKFEITPLTIDTQTSAGQINCTVSGGILSCIGDNRGYSQPVANDIFGCNSGPFAIEATDNAIHRAVVPRLCAAFDRSTLLLSGGNLQPSLDSTYYYVASSTNYYSKIIHQHEADGKGYAFSYDDVTPKGLEDTSGLLFDPNPILLTITVGGPKQK